MTAMRCWVVATLSATICAGAYSEPRSGPWETVVGHDRVSVITTDYVPAATFYFAYAIDGRSEEIFVATGDRTGLFPPQVRWTPPGKNAAAYVFVLNTTSSSVSLIPFERFLAMNTVSESFESLQPDQYPKMDTGGRIPDVSGLVSMGRGTVAAVSFDTEAREKSTIGLPSLLPFIGRQDVREKMLLHEGYAYLDVFSEQQLQRPRVRLRKKIEDFESHPDFSDLAAWVEGSPQPRLVLVDRQRGRHREQARLVLIDP